MGLLGNMIAKGVATAARNSTIKALGNAAVGVIAATSENQAQKEDSVVKNGKLYIKPTRSSENYLNENAREVANELLGAGFETIILKPVNKLSERATKKYGNICSITINGKSDFLGVKKVPASSYITIEFLDFKNTVNKDVYRELKRIPSGTVHHTSDLEETPQIGISDRSTRVVKFCSHCGAKVPSEKARFCAECGAEL